MEIDLELRVKLYNEYLNNGGIEEIVFPELLESLLKVKLLPNGKVDPNSIDSIANSAMLAYIGSQLMAPYNSDQYLSEYETLLQKSIFFKQINIETIEEFDQVFDEYINSNNILFRGLSEAKYRLYSSLQREWITSKLYEKHSSYGVFLASILKNTKSQEGGILPKYFDKIRIDPENDLAVLSFLQHYGCPTPLLDWTYSFANALFFATQNLQHPKGSWEIEKYFCVYYLEEESFEKASMQKIFSIGLQKQKEKLKRDFSEQLKTSGILDNIDKLTTPEHIDKMFFILHGKQLMTYMTKIERLLKAPILYFSDVNTDDNLKYCLNTSMNIVNQNGVFTWNAHPTKPLEHVASEYLKSSKEGKFVIFSKCININKSLEKHVKKRLKKLGINKRFIYPSATSIAQQAYRKSVSQYT